MKSQMFTLPKVTLLLVFFILILFFSFGDKGKPLIEIDSDQKNTQPTSERINDEKNGIKTNRAAHQMKDQDPSDKEVKEIYSFKNFALLFSNFSEIKNLVKQDPNCKRYPDSPITCFEGIYIELKNLVDSSESSLSRSPTLALSALNEIQVALCTHGSQKLPTVCSDLIIDIGDHSLAETKSNLSKACKANSRGCSALAHLKLKNGEIQENEAIQLFEQGCLAGEFHSCLDGAHQLRTIGKEDDAQLLYDKSCLLGNPNGCLEVINGKKILPEIRKVAEENLSNYCLTQKNIEACSQLANYYRNNNDFESFLSTTKFQCEAGDSSACYDYLEELGSKDLAQAKKFRKKICKWFLNFDIKTANEAEIIDGFSCTDDDLCLPNEKLKHFPQICNEYENYSAI